VNINGGERNIWQRESGENIIEEIIRHNNQRKQSIKMRRIAGEISPSAYGENGGNKLAKIISIES
jgi:hypothetical protein